MADSRLPTLYLPMIAEGDYESFRDILHGELPPSYREWLQRDADKLAYYRETHVIKRVQVKPSDFARYVHAGGYGADLNRLNIFAEIVGQRCGN